MTLSLTRQIRPEEKGEDTLCFHWSPNPDAPDPVWIPVATVRLVPTGGRDRVKCLVEACDDILVRRGELLTDEERALSEPTTPTPRNLRDIVIQAALQQQVQWKGCVTGRIPCDKPNVSNSGWPKHEGDEGTAIPNQWGDKPNVSNTCKTKEEFENDIRVGYPVTIVSRDGDVPTVPGQERLSPDYED